MRPMNRQIPFPPAGADWLESLRNVGKTEGTLDCYARDLRDVAEASGASEAEQLPSVGQTAVDLIAVAWRSAGVGEATIVRRFSALRGFAVYLVRERGMDLSSLLSADFPTAPKRRRQSVGADEIGRLLGDDPEGWRHVRDSALFAVQSDAGLTSAETVGLDLENVDLKNCLIRVVNTHLEPRIAGISERAQSLLQEYIRALPFDLAKADPLFVTSKRKRLDVRSAQVSFRRRRMRLGVSPRATLMGLRHANAARLVAQGNAPAVVANALGVLATTVGRYFDGEG